jgi:Gluconolactonase
LADRYEGKRLNSPNDLVVKSDGSIYFTDPSYGVTKDQQELGFYGVYRLASDGKLTLLVKDLVLPNGIAFSPDEQKLYVNNSEAKYIAVYDVKPDGTVTNERLFADLKDASQGGVPDGLKVDLEGNVYSTGPGGVWILSPDGKLLGRFLCLRRRLMWLGEKAIAKRFTLRQIQVCIGFALKLRVCGRENNLK